MVDTKTLIKASFEAGREFLRPPSEREAEAPSRPAPALVPIRSLGENHRGRITEHLLALAPHDRYLRFGHWANDEQIQRYSASLDFERDEIFGIYNRKLALIAVAHLAYAQDQGHDNCAEFGVSVLPAARGRGYGARLFDRAAMHAANDGISLMFIHALSENAAMLKIARNAGAKVERDGAESEAYLRLPPATLDSRVTEIIEEQIAQTDYRLKSQAKSFWSFLADLQAIRRDTIDANQRSSP
ncbi:MAG: GNAT family N-acetyltransferase [Curvibacter sp. RIFCSPHIGHO2_12_FULL_63_18]|uniref:GNAT family N-acetyltransferase n=1 Tax=Rhodoferax sp. TaxID=50421 RepID=UPI0008BB0BD4|nr:GNAT family N-acetyltransferase [Rhodoferax sp.]OGP00505.1 MAG: GNAT family N-acetyltransferase [Curvibacter sp. GWA2_63_95]OGP01814.1 MAG: GNAT family N-acetyltransferase [Curvibacter sp. RIFCSPHIGHO2_12_FULL_63_18]HCX82544.1 GNAT family N-acetyltransferase [Rhodoferax sp.]